MPSFYTLLTAAGIARSPTPVRREEHQSDAHRPGGRQARRDAHGSGDNSWCGRCTGGPSIIACPLFGLGADRRGAGGVAGVGRWTIREVGVTTTRRICSSTDRTRRCTSLFWPEERHGPDGGGPGDGGERAPIT